MNSAIPNSIKQINELKLKSKLVDKKLTIKTNKLTLFKTKDNEKIKL